jgi:tetratricopeptide (TPR) repeat protein
MFRNRNVSCYFCALPYAYREYKDVVYGNTTTRTYSDGEWQKTVVNGNTTTYSKKSSSDVDRYKTLVDENTTIQVQPYFNNSETMTIVDKQGYNIYIFIGQAYDLSLRAFEYYKQKDYDNAIADYTRTIMLDPNNANAYYSRSNAHYIQKNYGQAIADYEAALRVNPNHTNAREWLGKARQARGR